MDTKNYGPEYIRDLLEETPEPAWMTDIVGYGQFIDGKLVACSQSEMHVAIGSKNVECRPLYSVKESK
jgi:hypothetical protein